MGITVHVFAFDVCAFVWFSDLAKNFLRRKMSQRMAFEVYLVAELLKLKNVDMAKDTIDRLSDNQKTTFDMCGLPLNPLEFSSMMIDEGGVHKIVDSFTDLGCSLITQIVSDMKGNVVHGKILKRSSWVIFRDVDLGKIVLSPTEPWSVSIYEKYCWNPKFIAADLELWKLKPYCEWPAGRAIEPRTCLAERYHRGRFRIIDGNHRVIQAVRNEEKVIDICCPG